MSKLVRLLKRSYRYFRHDFPELVLPSSMPDPPHIKEQVEQERKARLTFAQRREAFSEAVREYTEDYARFLGLRKEANAPSGDTEREDEQSARAEGAELKRDAGEFARASLQQLRPALGELYRTRAAAYRDGLREFVLAYREAYAEAVQQGPAGAQTGASRPTAEEGASKQPPGAGGATEAGGGGGEQAPAAGAAPSRQAEKG